MLNEWVCLLIIDIKLEGKNIVLKYLDEETLNNL
jgi:hypothetical protein